MIARAALHMWEEPCISGENGSGTVFFSGCSLGCVFCQNRKIALGNVGKEISEERLVDIYFELEAKGANNINLVTADHFIPTVAATVEEAKRRGLRIPFLLNTGSYVSVEALKSLDGLIDIYLPDIKYINDRLAGEYSSAADYFETACKAVDEMVRQLRSRSKDGKVKNIFDENGIMKQGIIVRHLLLPGHVLDAKMIAKYLYDRYGDEIYISLMNQYTPMPEIGGKYGNLGRTVTDTEYQSLLDYASEFITKGFMQTGETADESFIPDFNCDDRVL